MSVLCDPAASAGLSMPRRAPYGPSAEAPSQDRGIMHAPCSKSAWRCIYTHVHLYALDVYWMKGGVVCKASPPPPPLALRTTGEDLDMCLCQADASFSQSAMSTATQEARAIRNQVECATARHDLMGRSQLISNMLITADACCCSYGSCRRFQMLAYHDRHSRSDDALVASCQPMQTRLLRFCSALERHLLVLW